MDVKTPDQTKLETSKQEEFFNIVLPEINSKRLVRKVAVDLPGIGEAATPTNTISDLQGQDVITPNPITPGATTDKDYTEVYRRLDEMKDIIDALMFEQRLKETSDEIMSKVEKMMLDLKKRIDDLYDRKIPTRRLFSTDGAYTSQIYSLVCEVLDQVIPPVYEDIPRYSLISNQISDVYDDGSVKNALVAISVTINNDGNRYDFKVDVPILEGVIQSPNRLERGRRLIPLTESALKAELESFSYRKTDIERPMEKPNLYSNVGSNPLRREDTQKFYEVNDPVPQSELPHDSQSTSMPGRRL